MKFMDYGDDSHKNTLIVTSVGFLGKDYSMGIGTDNKDTCRKEYL